MSPDFQVRIVTVLIYAGVMLGTFGLFVDLCSRLFGQYYPRTPAGSLLRVLFITLCSAMPVLPLLATIWFPGRAAELALRVAAVAGYGVFLHFLMPYRWGLRRVGAHDTGDRVRPLCAKVILRETTIAVPSLSREAPLTFLVLSDLHCNRPDKLTLLRDALGAMAEDPLPDGVLVLGDLTEKNEHLEPVLDLIAGLRSRHGTFLVRGNHELEDGRDALIPDLAAARGITLLSNARRVLPELDVCVLGVEGPWRKEPPPGDLTATGFTIGLTHSPDMVFSLARAGVAVAVAGHTHGGGIPIPLIGPLLVPVRSGRFLRRGLFRYRGLLLYITVGLGHFPGLRGRPGEIVRLRVVPAAATE